MRASSHSPVATVLLLIPIITVPLLAIFGVPQIVPTVPKAVDVRRPNSSAPEFVPGPKKSAWDDVAELPAPAAHEPLDHGWSDLQSDATAKAIAERRAAVQRGDSAPLKLRSPDALRLASADDKAASALVTTAEHSDVLPGPSAAAQMPNSLKYERPPQANSSVPPARISRNPAAAPVPALTWQAAVKRLNDLEIRNFRLEPGQQAEHFVFICSYTPQDNPRISYRFEAEADEPLRAVEKVLAQIDTWLAGR